MMADIANYLVSCSIASYRITKLLSYILKNMVYKRIKGSRQIVNYLAGLSYQIAFPNNNALLNPN